MSQFNSIFSPLSNKLARLAGITLLAVAALFASTQQMSAQGAPGTTSCVTSLEVRLGRTTLNDCSADVTVDMVVLGGGTTGLDLRINDLNPTNGGRVDGISPASGWVYGVYRTSDNTLVCTGVIYAVDYTAPLVTDPADHYQLTCDDIDKVLNTTASWSNATGASEYAYFTGALTSVGTDNCGGLVQVKVTDRIDYTDCGVTGDPNLMATITRTFLAIDQRGNDTTVTQLIKFKRPSKSLLAVHGAGGRLAKQTINGQPVYSTNGTQGTTATYLNVPTTATAPNMVVFDKCTGIPSTKDDLRAYLQSIYTYKYGNSTSTGTNFGGTGQPITSTVGADSLSFFNNGLNALCNYSSDFTWTEFPTCNGKKFAITASVVDWCNSANNFTDYWVLAFEDRTAPVFGPENASINPVGTTAPSAGTIRSLEIADAAAKNTVNIGSGLANDTVRISVGTNDCTAALRLGTKADNLRDLRDLFNVKISDACTATGSLNISYTLSTQNYWNDRFYVKQAFTVTPYTTMRTSTNTTILGIPVGTHRLEVVAHDGCNNQDKITLIFEVIDGVAPVMKCDDLINVSLTSNSSSNYFIDANKSDADRTLQLGARVRVEDVNEGSRDNCTLDSLYVRRIVRLSTCLPYLELNMDYDLFGNNDGKVDALDFPNKVRKTSANGNNEFETDLVYTPNFMQYVEVFCCDGGNVMVELWGSDTRHYNDGPIGNWSYCWTNIKVEDPTAPVVNAPKFNTTYNKSAVNYLSCTDKEWFQGGNYTRTKIATSAGLTEAGTAINNDNTTEGRIATVAAANAKFGTPDIYGIECSGDVYYTVLKKLTCDTGVILRIWDVEKVDKNGATVTVSDTQLIWVEANHNYTITVPADVVDAKCTSSTGSAPTFDEDGCDLLAMSTVRSTIYDAAVGENACKKVYNTWTIINWCQVPNQLTCASADPMNYARVIPRINKTGIAFAAASATLPASSVSHKYTQSNSNTNRDHGTPVGANERQFIDRLPAATGANWPATAKSNTYAMGIVKATGETGTFTLANGNYPKSDLPGATGNACSGLDIQTFAWTYTQVIKVSDDVKPFIVANEALGLKFTPLDNVSTDDVNWNASKKVFGVRGNRAENVLGETILPTGTECQAMVRFTFEVSDACVAARRFTIESSKIVRKTTPLSDVEVTGLTLEVTPLDPKATSEAPSNGTFTVNADKLTIDQTTGKSDYQLVVTFRDDCGNVAVDRIDFTVADIKAPSPVCVQQLNASLMPTNSANTPDRGMVIIRARDLFQDINRNWDSEECTRPVKIGIVRKNRDTATVASTVRNYPSELAMYCADVNGDSSVLRVYIVDAAGNYNYCEVSVVVIDGAGICADGQSSPAAVAGAIQTESKATVEGVQVNLSGQTQKSFATGVNGLFVFNNLAAGADYTVTPSLNKGFLNGVSTFDLVLISKHILGVQPLNTPYKLIAADVNNSKSVTTLDLIQLRKLILNIDATFANNSSWRFVDATYTFPNASNPWAASFPEVKNVNDLVGSLSANFVAVKVGDVNGNAIANSTQGSVRNLTSNLGINVADMNMVAGNEYKVDFTAADLNGIEGFQFTLNLDKKGLELVDLVPGIAAEENFGIFAEEGVVTASWNGEAKGGVLFSLVVRAKSNTTLSEVLNLNSRYTAAEAYKGGEVVNVGLNFNASKASANYELYQNTPNPFAGESIIGFNLPAAGAATLTIQDVTGRTLKVINGQYAKGYNQVSLKSTELSATGVLTYTLKAADFTATRKMIIVE